MRNVGADAAYAAVFAGNDLSRRPFRGEVAARGLVFPCPGSQLSRPQFEAVRSAADEHGETDPLLVETRGGVLGHLPDPRDELALWEWHLLPRLSGRLASIFSEPPATMLEAWLLEWSYNRDQPGVDVEFVSPLLAHLFGPRCAAEALAAVGWGEVAR